MKGRLMSDPDAPDPVDGAYMRAETILTDDDARAARRARVLTAVAREPITPARPSIRRPARRFGGWLAAASVVGFSVFVATRLYQPAARQPPTVLAPSPAAAISAPGVVAAPTPPASASSKAPVTQALPAAPRAATPTPAPSPADAVPVNAPAPPPLKIAPIERPAPPPPVVASPRSLPAPPPAAAPLRRLESSAGVSSDKAARLRAAAAAGRTDEVEDLLAQDVPIDAPDADGETALMKSIQADQRAVAALLNRHGASLDRKNRAGESAKDMATAKGDEALSKALGLER